MGVREDDDDEADDVGDDVEADEDGDDMGVREDDDVEAEDVGDGVASSFFLSRSKLSVSLLRFFCASTISMGRDILLHKRGRDCNIKSTSDSSWHSWVAA